jgi:uncharacterized protein YyaL (SSP411 family)
MRVFNATATLFRFSLLLTGSIALGCAAPSTRATAPHTASASVVGDVSHVSHVSHAGAEADPMQGAPKEPLPWADFSAATFAKAKAERRFIVMDGSAEWCHWCHVMEATTYHDPAVKKLLGERFVQVKVDIDSRPDLEERYGDYGWPATVIFSPDAEEIGKYRGYIEPEKFVEILQAVVDAPQTGAKASASASRGGEASKPFAPLSEEQIAWIHRFTVVELDEYYDDKQGGWGRTPKAPLAWDNAWALAVARGAGSDAAKMREKVLFTLDRQNKLIDPVWGGIYQYSAAADWDHAHFEKLMPFQAGALDNYASAYALTHDAKYADLARAMRRYIDAFLKGPEGGFYTTQDADLNAHDPSARFMSGHDYYAKGDAARRALGIPRIDTHEYGKDNGLAIAAYVTLFEATADPSALATAERAADRVWKTHASARGGLAHDAQPSAAVLHLADNASMGFALMRLFEVTKKPELLAAATRIADFMMKELNDPILGGFYAHSIDPDAVGVFAARRKPFEDNVMAIRFLARRVRAGGAGSEAYERAIAGAIRAIATPDEIKNRGRMLGDFLLALDESKGVRAR